MYGLQRVSIRNSSILAISHGLWRFHIFFYIYFKKGFPILPSYLNATRIYRVVKKKREPKLFYKSSQNICPIKMKICMHNLNTYSFQNIKYEILNPKTFLDIWRCFWFSKMKNEQKHSFLVYFGFILVRHLIGRVDKLGEYGSILQTFV